jgi:hypothetical protein
VLWRMASKAGRIAVELSSKSSLNDCLILPYLSFQEWYVWRVGLWSSDRWLPPRGGWEGRRREIEMMLWSVRDGYFFSGMMSMVGWMGGRECQELK